MPIVQGGSLPAAPVYMINLTATQEITRYQWAIRMRSGSVAVGFLFVFNRVGTTDDSGSEKIPQSREFSDDLFR
jgi:hypothetical protein